MRILILAVLTMAGVALVIVVGLFLLMACGGGDEN